LLFSFTCYRPVIQLALPSFPTRRSSDLDFGVAVAGDGADLSHLLRRLDLDRHLLEFGGDILNRFLDALLHLDRVDAGDDGAEALDRKSTRLNSSHVKISYAVFCLKKKKQ